MSRALFILSLSVSPNQPPLASTTSTIVEPLQIAVSHNLRLIPKQGNGYTKNIHRFFDECLFAIISNQRATVFQQQETRLMSKSLLSCALGLLLAACAGWPEGAQSPTVTLTDIRPLEFGLLEQRYLIRLRIQNPNAFDLPINGLSYQLEINDQPFARGVSNRLLNVPS
jgi:hypothetical protein